MDFLAQMAEASWARVRSIEVDVDALREVPASPRRLAVRDFQVIAEVKFNAPSAGVLGTGDASTVIGRARTYADAGAAAVSVLTEPTRFDGSLAYLSAAAALAVPVMRKDFLVDPVQVWEARAHGASGVLLIAAMLDDPTLERMLTAAAQAGLFVLLEAFDAADLRRCEVDWAGDQPLWVGVNARDLRTLKVETGRLERLAPLLPADRLAVAESGVGTAEDASRVASWGYRAVLVGTSLMRSADPGGQIRAMTEAGASACG